MTVLESGGDLCDWVVVGHQFGLFVFLELVLLALKEDWF